MPAAARLDEGWLLRPLLEVERASELLAYAHRYDLRWIEDASNASLDFDRNYLRWRIMPLLRERWPAASRAGPFGPMVRRNRSWAGCRS